MTKAIHCRRYFAAAAVTSQTSRHGAERRDGLYKYKIRYNFMGDTLFFQFCT